MPNETGNCVYCHAECTPLRCSQCKVAIYCSRQCQKKHWREGHREECLGRANSSSHQSAKNKEGTYRRKENSQSEVLKAANELNNYISSISLEEAHEQYVRATDQIVSIQRELKKKSGKKPHISEDVAKPFSPRLKSIETKRPSSREFSPKENNFESKKENSKTLNDPKTENSLIDDDEFEERNVGSFLMSGKLECFVENLPNILCYYVTLIIPHSEKCALSKNTETGINSLKQLKFFVEHYCQGQKSIRDSIPSALSHVKIVLPARNNHLKQNDIFLSINLCGTIIKKDVSLSIDDNFICIRLPYKDKSFCLEDNEMNNSYTPTPLNDINSLNCKFCGQYLTLVDNRPKSIPKLEQGKLNCMKIKKVLPLPTGYWDEILDYLTCYEGQHYVDFSSHSTGAKLHHALENNSVIVLHKNDLGDSVDVLAIEGYGEYTMKRFDKNDQVKLNLNNSLNGFSSNKNEETDVIKNVSISRGDKTWKDLVGGATICCSRCCSILGFASLDNTDTFRLLKHRLSSRYEKEKGRYSENTYKANTCGTFIASEMIRYADSQAIFTFALINTSSKVPGTTHNDSNTHGSFKCIFLKLVSWDTFVAVPNSSKGDKTSVRQNIHFSRALKVIFEEKTDFQISSSNTENSYFWGGVDFCCPPQEKFNFGKDESKMISKEMNNEITSEIQPSSSVRIFLSENEWTEIREDLKQGSHYFTKSVTSATVIMKLGQPSSEAKLSLLTCQG